MFTKPMIAAGLTMVANLAAARPGLNAAPVGAVNNNNAPDYCQIIGNERANVEAIALDLSQDCADAGISNKCCMSFLASGPDHPMSEQDRNDLMAVVAEQSKKTHWYSTSIVGVWSASFDNVFTSYDKIDSQLLQVWFHAIQSDINLAGSSTLGSIIFQIHGGTGDIDNYMRVDRHG